MAELRYFGQEHSLEVSIDGVSSLEEIKTRFNEAHSRRYGHSMSDPVQLVNIRVRGIGQESKPTLNEIVNRASGESIPQLDNRLAYCFATGELVEFSVYDRGVLMSGDKLPGPAIIEETTTTTVFYSDQKAEIDKYGQIIITQEFQ